MLKRDRRQAVSSGIGATLKIGAAIGRNSSAGDIICLFGELGSGKTVLAKGIAAGIGIEKNRVISPTFVLLREYRRGSRELYHFDLYRLNHSTESFLSGWEEYLYGRGLSVVEWAEKLGRCIPEQRLDIKLSVTGERSRRLKFYAYGRRHCELLKAVMKSV